MFLNSVIVLLQNIDLLGGLKQPKLTPCYKKTYIIKVCS